MANITPGEIQEAEKLSAVACTAIPWSSVVKALTPTAESWGSKAAKALYAKFSKGSGCLASCCGSLGTCIPGLSSTTPTKTTTDSGSSKTTTSFIDYPVPFKESTTTKTTTGATTTTKAAALRRFSISSKRSLRANNTSTGTATATAATAAATAAASMRASIVSSTPTTRPSPSSRRTSVNRATVRSAIYAPSAFDQNALHVV